ncbi:PAS domain S-box-containing protein [Geothermobacter ehrlichii]|uniref:histidine kinase n=1 Tax=Geothermobacter ehrlichii TaxID=213224 RepID=A0A5D3WGH9_9BACT|nr:PAS domain-containing sensor histidine kinase [Geothermobacter ehrlichii]TYO96624.1 PAS domain S-box-containing protein [Geothermobacter ehrlichii]
MSAITNSRKLIDLLSLKTTLDTIPSALFLVDRNQHIVYWNRAAEDLTGYPAAEILGRHCSILEGIECGRNCGLYDPDIRKPIRNAICTIKTKEGKPLTISKNVDYLRHEGKIVGGIESFIDLSRQIRLEQRLRAHGRKLEEAVARRTRELEEEKKRLSNLLEAMTDFAYIVTPDNRIEYMNPAMIACFGDQTGKICHEALYGKKQPCVHCPSAQILAGKVMREERSNPRTGKIYEILHTPLHGPNGPERKLAVCRDITERKEAEEALRQANAELASFAHTVSHDLRTPLTPIIGYAEFLQMEYGNQLDERAREILSDIEQQGYKLLRMMEDLLSLAQVGRLPNREQAAPIRPLVEETLLELSETIDEKGVRIDLGPLPETVLPETPLRQVISNLLRNALAHGCPPGGRIVLGGDRAGSCVRLWVRDYGRGLPDSEKERIFRPFTRGDRPQGSGTGIGLAIVEKIARLYHGRVRVEDTPGGGATFVIELNETTG